MRLQLVLPPGWFGLPLTDPAGCDRIIDRTVRALSLDDGEGARLRRELRADLERQARSARDTGATLLALSGPRSAPLSGSLLVTPLRPTVDLDDPRFADDLDGESETFTVPVGRVTRVVGRRQAPAGRRSDDGELPTLGIDYWVAGPDKRHQAQVACSTPLFEHAEAMTQLFDAVICSARWAESARGRAETGS